MLQALPVAGAAVNPTRFMNKNTPLSDMTIDQFFQIHGENPNPKVIPERPIGPPRSRDELRKAQDQVRTQPPAATYATPHEEREAADRAFEGTYRTPTSPSPLTPSASPGPGPTPARPRPKAKVIRPVEPTPGGPFGRPMNEPCRDVLHLEFDIEDIGLVLLPLECEVLGEHPNMPHMVRVPGLVPRDPDTEQDVFVGWADAI